MKLFQLDPSMPSAAFVNPKIADSQRLYASEGIPFTYDEMKSSFPGDPLTGSVIPGTTITWNGSTEVQGLIFEFYQVQGEKNPGQPPFPPDLDEILKANPGPVEKWNGSYEDWGLVPGVSAKYPTIETVEVSTGRRVVVFIP